jgi:hypothetical protein
MNCFKIFFQIFSAKTFQIFVLIFVSYSLESQDLSNPLKGSLFFHWGWNRAEYSRSDLHFKGAHHDFTLYNVRAVDRQTKFNWDTYFNPGTLTTPQYNFRLGYFLSNKYSISVGLDHMKYVMVQDQQVAIKGNIASGSKYDGVYTGQLISLSTDFLKFEHTNGLNYLNTEVRRLDPLSIKHHLVINLATGLGAGVLIPKTDATLLNNKENDQFHLSGFGLSASGGINITFFKHFFIQSEVKGGLVDMPDIRTTMSAVDKADQRFWFAQLNAILGASIKL